MKKFNFLVAFAMVLFLTLSFDSFGQEMLSSQKALQIVQDQVETLKKNTSPMSANANGATKVSTVHAMKIAVGENMLEDLKTGKDVGSTLNAALRRFQSNVPERNEAVQEVELFYRNLLRKPF